MMEQLATRLVWAAQSYARLVVIVTALATVAMTAHTVQNLGVNTDTVDLVDAKAQWRERDRQFANQFPQNEGLIVAVIDGATPDLAEEAAAKLTARLASRPDLFSHVRRPDGGPFFNQNGLLYLDLPELTATLDQTIAAQPMIGTLVADPSLRGLAGALSLAVEGIAEGAADRTALDVPLAQINEALTRGLTGSEIPMSWQRLFSNREPLARELRRFVLCTTPQDFQQLETGGAAISTLRAILTEEQMIPARGVTVRLTGPVPLADEEFATVAEGAGVATVASFAVVLLILFLALRAARLIVAIMVTLITGLVATAFFAAIAIGSLNLISVAFAVLFVGIGVDFGIQFAVRYRDQRFQDASADLSQILAITAARIGPPLTLAGVTTALGFFAFLPTSFAGVRELGLIAGVGMGIAWFLNLTLLPALLTLLRPAGEAEPIGYRWTAGLDRFLLTQRRAVMLVALLLGLAAIAIGTRVSFDFNPINLKDQTAESVATLLDLSADPETAPNSLDLLTPDLATAQALAARLASLPEVGRSLTVASFIPEDQEPKLAAIADARDLLGPTFSPAAIAAPPSPEALRQALRGVVSRIAALSDPTPPLQKFASLATTLAAADDTILIRTARVAAASLPGQLSGLRDALEAAPVTLDSLPRDLRQDWIARDGRFRVEVAPAGDSQSNAVLVRFVEAIVNVAPDATGAPITIIESGRLVRDAFLQSGIIAVVAIILVLAFVLRRVRDVLLVLAPLTLAVAFTLATMVIFDMSLNFANVITLPLLLGIGVSFDIYFVLNHRAGLRDPLGSPTAKAVLFSALTTASAFGSLALSSHPGTATMGLLLLIALGYCLLTTLLVLPSLMGEPRVASEEPRSSA
jgi:hopanoid biosynthesis associated RND transporter like protein HpnN